MHVCIGELIKVKECMGEGREGKEMEEGPPLPKEAPDGSIKQRTPFPFLFLLWINKTKFLPGSAGVVSPLQGQKGEERTN
mmetsp:Transcript_54698/g.106994  ORF Transcript_54698/g.106994 Transcript_54698/m.106994 type:complete len:80 (+) Transcript_54698:115-354(+)